MKFAKSNTNYCFIGGSGRSGTTILKKILSAHPDVASMHEFRITIDPDGLVDFYSSLCNNWNPYLFDVKYKRLQRLLKTASKTSLPEKANRLLLKKTGFNKLPFKMERQNAGVGISDYCPDYDDLVEDLLDGLTDFSYKGFSMGNTFGTHKIYFSGAPEEQRLDEFFAEFYKNMVSSVINKQQASAFVDDNTWNILHFHTIRKWIPEAKLVHIYRHPLDVISSFTQQSWTPSDPLESARFYLSLLQKWFEVRKLLPEDSYREVSLEDLVSTPKKILQQLIDFYGLDWRAEILSVDLSKSNSGRWKKDLPKSQLKDIVEIIRPILNEYGYSTDD